MTYYYEQWEHDDWDYDPWEHDDEQVAPDFYGGGYLTRMAIPPLAVLAISVVLFITLSSIPIASTAVLDTSSASAAEIATDTSEEPTAPDLADSSQLASLFTIAVRHWEPQILTWAKEWELDPNLVATVMQIESCGDPQARSYAGATGLFQVMPFHFAQGENAYDPQTNAWRGMSYLKRSLHSHNGDTRLALAGYNGGIGGSQRPESHWPAETVRYTYWGDGIYKDAREGKSHSPRLEEWLSAGGASLCAQAKQRLGLP